MALKAVFGDTFFFLALVNPRDAAHSTAISAARTLKARTVTTEWIITELADGLCARNLKPVFMKLLNDIRQSPTIEIVPFSEELQARGLDLYRSRADKDWSLTDCVSFAVMQERGITDALTQDHHFEQAGFSIQMLRG